jgi:hypothetical protein
MCDRCEPLAAHPSRRQLLGWGALAAAGALVGLPGRGARADERGPTRGALPAGGQARQVVLLYMNGGASHFETFDPKPGTTEGGPTRTIATKVPGVHIASTLPLLAARMDRIALIRGMSTKEGNHDRARYLMHTGYAPTPTVQHPGIGSWLSHEKAAKEAALPAYVAINGPGSAPGLVGPGHAPFQVRTPQGNAQGRRPQAGPGRGTPEVVQNLRAPGSVPAERRDRRLDLLGELNEGFGAAHGTGMTQAQAAMFERARQLMDTPQNTAFDVTAETAATQDRYGRNDFGQGCLMARRLLEQGVTCVEVMSNGWDTHDDNFNRVAALNADIDRGASALLDDLAASGRLGETLVVWLGDFGRTPRITASQGRGHFPAAWSTWLAGGGVHGGRVIGRTSADGSEVVDGRVGVEDLFASIAHATGMDPQRTLYANGRPISLVNEIGHPVADLFKA